MSGESAGVGWGVASLSVRRREPASWQSLHGLGKGCEGWNAEWEERPRPTPTPQKVLLLVFQGSGERPSWGRRRRDDAPSRPPGSGQG